MLIRRKQERGIQTRTRVLRKVAPHRAQWILPIVTPEEPATYDVVELARQVWDSASARVVVWVDGMIVRNTAYPDIDEARTAAQRLGEERG